MIERTTATHFYKRPMPGWVVVDSAGKSHHFSGPYCGRDSVAFAMNSEAQTTMFKNLISKLRMVWQGIAGDLDMDDDNDGEAKIEMCIDAERLFHTDRLAMFYYRGLIERYGDLLVRKLLAQHAQL